MNSFPWSRRVIALSISCIAVLLAFPSRPVTASTVYGDLNNFDVFFVH